MLSDLDRLNLAHAHALGHEKLQFRYYNHNHPASEQNMELLDPCPGMSLVMKRSLVQIAWKLLTMALGDDDKLYEGMGCRGEILLNTRTMAVTLHHSHLKWESVPLELDLDV